MRQNACIFRRPGARQSKTPRSPRRVLNKVPTPLWGHISAGQSSIAALSDTSSTHQIADTLAIQGASGDNPIIRSTTSPTGDGAAKDQPLKGLLCSPPARLSKLGGVEVGKPDFDLPSGYGDTQRVAVADVGDGTREGRTFAGQRSLAWIGMSRGRDGGGEYERRKRKPPDHERNTCCRWWARYGALRSDGL